ncbi:hypothetical protein MEO41_28845, partial [Dolichospermum sp. ST_sed4]|nr:hypothetical protein [Dolichospermum sp. ST_sed4]
MINITNRAKTIPFYVSDDSGKIRVEIKTEKHELFDSKGKLIGIEELPDYTNSDVDAFYASSGRLSSEGETKYKEY